MRALYLFAIVTCFASFSKAQNINNYLFSSINGSFTYLPLTAITPNLASGSLNEGLYPQINIGISSSFFV